ncbi:NUDIX domain-containing protein [Acholeplasma vituli]|uniref:NUDIX domain-containing protein n=1 Tax=Paracholeplasma vituli TaxID=69473 RepID=A0ABT2PY22_9MOLU|nr:NUDIX domain-containing protein [Paracholeplasma vituli]MCU0104627.1 NUDIX domain-containing protein [Paracholeplasma vituli]
MVDLFTEYQPKSDLEVADLAYILDAIKHYGEALFMRHPAMHFSSSAMIFNPSMTKTLLIYHKLYDSWGWTGGHMDGDTDFLKVAIKEAKEETGLDSITCLNSNPISIEVLPVWFHYKHGKPISSHLHLNASYILIADDQLPLKQNVEETNGVKWVNIDEITQYVSEPEMMPIYQKIIERGKK